MIQPLCLGLTTCTSADGTSLAGLVGGLNKVSLCVSVTQSCPALCHPMDCSPSGSSVHGILQARRLEWVAISSSRGSSLPRDQTQVSRVSCVAGKFFYRLNHLESPKVPLVLLRVPPRAESAHQLGWVLVSRERTRPPASFPRLSLIQFATPPLAPCLLCRECPAPCHYRYTSRSAQCHRLRDCSRLTSPSAHP